MFNLFITAVGVTAEKRIIEKAARGLCRHQKRGSRTCLGMLQNLSMVGRNTKPAFNRVKKLNSGNNRSGNPGEK